MAALTYVFRRSLPVTLVFGIILSSNSIKQRSIVVELMMVTAL
ncbi:MAG TPA: hypothetical protein V6D34_09930 [Candidatus Sericytochromatia bacterium]